jgi:hypothetical protein
MKSFKHPITGQWNLTLTVGTVAEIESRLGVNLGLPDWGTPPLYARIIDDPVLASRILWIVCQASAKDYQIPEDQFYDDILVGQTFMDAHVSLLKEYRDFFQARSIGGAGQRLSKLLSEFLDLISSGNSFTNLPDTSDKTPPDTASAS